MPTECNLLLFGFAAVDGHRVAAAFDGEAITSDAGALLLRETNRAIRLTGRFAVCFHRRAGGETCRQEVGTMVLQWVRWHLAELRRPERPRRNAALGLKQSNQSW